MPTCEWVRYSLIPYLIRVCKIVKTEFKQISCSIFKDEKSKNFMGSDTFRVTLGIELLDGSIEELSLIVKLVQGSIMQSVSLMDVQYYNEITMYVDVMRELNICEMAPKCYHAQFSEGITYIVLEDLEKLGYELNSYLILSLDHIELALEQLGKLHGACYAMKENNFERFMENISFFHEPRYDPDKVDRNFLRVQSFCLLRALRTVSEGYFDQNQIYRLLEKFSNLLEFYVELVTPVEPLAVLCHGCFNKNNLLFKYDESKKVTSVKVIDFQMVRYASPAIDLSFFLFMNVHPEVRKQKRAKLFNIYYNSLTKTLISRCPQVDMTKYSKAAFRNDYRNHMLYGVAICSYFLLFMYNAHKPNLASYNPNFSDHEIENFVDDMWTDEAEIAVSSMMKEEMTIGALHNLISD